MFEVIAPSLPVRKATESRDNDERQAGTVVVVGVLKWSSGRTKNGASRTELLQCRRVRPV
jgi:hypothetical protein